MACRILDIDLNVGRKNFIVCVGTEQQQQQQKLGKPKHVLTLFERSEFLIATCKKKKTDRLCVCVDVRLILVLVWKKCLGFSVGYVYGQSTVYLCLSKYIVFENTHAH